jgi:hypothetical protein
MLTSSPSSGSQLPVVGVDYVAAKNGSCSALTPVACGLLAELATLTAVGAAAAGVDEGGGVVLLCHFLSL